MANAEDKDKLIDKLLNENNDLKRINDELIDETLELDKQINILKLQLTRLIEKQDNNNKDLSVVFNKE
jgi:hypothetical protein